MRTSTSAPDAPAAHRVVAPQYLGQGPVIGLGELLWDLLPDGPACGGAPANAACQVAALGWPAAVVSRVAADPLGQTAIDFLRSHRLDCRGIQIDLTPQGPATGTVEVEVDAEGRPSYHFATDPAWDHLTWSETLAAFAREASAVVFGTLAQRAALSRSTIHRFLSTTSPRCLRVFDVNLRQSFFTADVIRESLDRASVLKLNLEELPAVAQACDITATDRSAALVDLARRFELIAVALTCGPDGSVIATTGSISTRPATAVTVVDTVGAGDAFTAGLVTGLLATRSAGPPAADTLETIHDLASALAGIACGHRGAMPRPMDLARG
jgi:fructokinase